MGVPTHPFQVGHSVASACTRPHWNVTRAGMLSPCPPLECPQGRACSLKGEHALSLSLCLTYATVAHVPDRSSQR